MSSASTNVAGTPRVPSPWPDRRRIGATAEPGSRRAVIVGRRDGGGLRCLWVTARHGFTLVELLVVILIMLMITAISIPVIAPSLKNRDVREAARMIDVFINGARTRAMQAGHPFGVMFEREPGNPNACTTLSYCEQPGAYSGDSNLSTVRCLGNGGFGAWALAVGTTVSTVDQPFPLNDLGWVQSTLSGNAGYLTTISPGDTVTIKGTAYRIWAGEPFADLNQNGIGDPGEPFLDVDASGSWTPPNPAPGQPGNVTGQPYVDPGSGYFVQPNMSATSPFPQITYGTQSAFITYCYADQSQAFSVMNSMGRTPVLGMTGLVTGPGAPIMIGPPPSINTTVSAGGGLSPNMAQPSASFSFVGKPLRTSSPSVMLPTGAAIDFGANYPDAQFAIIVPIPGSGIEVLSQQANQWGWFSTFRANPALDPTVPGSLAQGGTFPSDPTGIAVMFQPIGGVDRIYSWSEANETNTTMSAVNWTDWQGRIPAGPIYFLVGRHELVNGDPNLVPRIANGQAPFDPVTKTGGPIYNVQDPNALWVTIQPQSGSVSTAENYGFDLTVPIPIHANVSGANALEMQDYWAGSVYYARKLAREMADMGGR